MGSKNDDQLDLFGSSYDSDIEVDNEEYRELIDFINRQAKELGGRGIDYNYYRTMSDRELDERYNKIMANWENNHKDLTLKSLFNTL